MSESSYLNSDAYERLFQILRCPKCHVRLSPIDGKLSCDACGLSFGPNDEGFNEFILDSSLYQKESTTLEKAEAQESGGAVRVDDEYIKPFLHKECLQRVLDVGCGTGRTVSRLLDDGCEAYGIDLPCLSSFWSEAGNSRNHFVCCDALALPFEDDFFDVVMSLGVIEHIGTVGGHSTLAPNYAELRQQFADELLRVTRPGGRILVACPNKRFPVDPQHQVSDESSPDALTIRIRDRIFRKTGLNFHPVWGRYHLLSYPEVRKLFFDNGKARQFDTLPLKNYFGLSMFKSGYLRPLGKIVELYLNWLPRPLRTTFANPYVLVQIRK